MQALAPEVQRCAQLAVKSLIPEHMLMTPCDSSRVQVSLDAVALSPRANDALLDAISAQSSVASRSAAPAAAASRPASRDVAPPPCSPPSAELQVVAETPDQLHAAPAAELELAAADTGPLQPAEQPASGALSSKLPTGEPQLCPAEDHSSPSTAPADQASPSSDIVYVNYAGQLLRQDQTASAGVPGGCSSDAQAAQEAMPGADGLPAAAELAATLEGGSSEAEGSQLAAELPAPVLVAEPPVHEAATCRPAHLAVSFDVPVGAQLLPSPTAADQPAMQGADASEAPSSPAAQHDLQAPQSMDAAGAQSSPMSPPERLAAVRTEVRNGRQSEILTLTTPTAETTQPGFSQPATPAPSAAEQQVQPSPASQLAASSPAGHAGISPAAAERLRASQQAPGAASWTPMQVSTCIVSC